MIPKIIHQIWIGGEIPPNITEQMKTVKDNHPDYKYILWDNSTLKELGVLHLIGTTKESFISNIMRCLILNKYGGYYIDADTIAIGCIDDLNIPQDSKLVVCLLDTGGYWKYQNAFISSIKGYDFDNFLNKYIPNKPSIPIWNNFCFERDLYEIKHSEFSMVGNIFKDTRLGSWLKELKCKLK